MGVIIIIVKPRALYKKSGTLGPARAAPSRALLGLGSAVLCAKGPGRRLRSSQHCRGLGGGAGSKAVSKGCGCLSAMPLVRNACKVPHCRRRNIQDFPVLIFRPLNAQTHMRTGQDPPWKIIGKSLKTQEIQFQKIKHKKQIKTNKN